MKKQPAFEDYLFTLYANGGTLSYTELTEIVKPNGMDEEETYTYSICVLEYFHKRGYIEKVVGKGSRDMVASLTEEGERVAEFWAEVLSERILFEGRDTVAALEAA